MIETPSESVAAPPSTADSLRTEGRRYPGLVETLVVGFVVLVATVFLALLMPEPQLPGGRAAAGSTERILQDFSWTDSWAEINSAVVGVPLVLLVCWLRRYGSSVKDFLGLHWPSLRQALLWTAVFLAYELLSGGLLRLLPVGSGPHRSFELFRAAPSVPLTMLAYVVCAPLQEEIFYRGFLLPGAARSPIRAVGAVLLIAAIWALSHQYDPRNSVNVFLLGVLLGTARLRSGSVLLPMGLHGLANLLIDVQMARLLQL